MQRFFLLLLLTCFYSSVTAQHTLSFTVKDKHTNEVLTAATVQVAQRTAVSDSSGHVSFNNLQAGTYKAKYPILVMLHW